jgi:broad specificity phosphatase PhoE
MRALLLRHGESAHNAHSGEEPLAAEAGDVLTERGRAQAAAAGEALRGFGVDRLLASPMRRAAETAAAVGAALGLEPEPAPYAFEYVGEESFEEAIERVRLAKRSLAALPDERVLLVSHGIFTRLFLLDSLLGESFGAADLRRIWQLRSCNCGLTTFTYGEPGEPDESLDWSCLSWMERPWDRP